jgi:tetrahedral aminopeptidase
MPNHQEPAMATADNIDLLKRLCETPGIPGREERVRALIEKEVKGLFDTVTTDALGNLICRRGPRSGSASNGKTPAGKDRPTRVMLLSHMDEIGFYVTHIDEKKGWLWMNPAGGFDARTLFARRVFVCTDNGDIRGVMNPCGRPLHISLPKDREKIPEIKEFYVDIGLPADEIKKKVKVGDYVVPDEPLVETGNKVVSKALDNRVACWLGIEAIRTLDASRTGHNCEIVVAFTTQEEVGLRGAKNASFQVQPDIGIGLDVTLSCDTPGVPEEEAVTRNGEGFGLHLKDGSFIADYTLVREFEELAKKKEIPFQRSILAAGGQDGAAAQQSAAGARAIGITVGTRYIHTIAEMVDKRDLFAARDILAAYLAQVQ